MSEPMDSTPALHRSVFAVQGRALLWRLSIIFVLLALLIELTLFAYWRYSLQPRLQSEAQAQISLLAQSQAPLLASALAAPPAQVRAQVQAALDQLLLLKGPSGGALIEGVSLDIHQKQSVQDERAGRQRGTALDGLLQREIGKPEELDPPAE